MRILKLFRIDTGVHDGIESPIQLHGIVIG